MVDIDPAEPIPQHIADAAAAQTGHRLNRRGITGPGGRVGAACGRTGCRADGPLIGCAAYPPRVDFQFFGYTVHRTSLKGQVFVVFRLRGKGISDRLGGSFRLDIIADIAGADQAVKVGVLVARVIFLFCQGQLADLAAVFGKAVRQGDQVRNGYPPPRW